MCARVCLRRLSPGFSACFPRKTGFATKGVWGGDRICKKTPGGDTVYRAFYTCSLDGIWGKVEIAPGRGRRVHESGVTARIVRWRRRYWVGVLSICKSYFHLTLWHLRERISIIIIWFDDWIIQHDSGEENRMMLFQFGYRKLSDGISCSIAAYLFVADVVLNWNHHHCSQKDYRYTFQTNQRPPSQPLHHNAMCLMWGGLRIQAQAKRNRMIIDLIWSIKQMMMRKGLIYRMKRCVYMPVVLSLQDKSHLDTK